MLVSRVKLGIGAQLQIYFNLHEILAVERTASENGIEERHEVEDSPCSLY